MSLTSTHLPARRKRTNPAPFLYLATGLLLVTSLGFMVVQNSFSTVGGPISLPKTLWLDWTLTIFYLVPFFLWKTTAFAPGMRVLFGWLLLSFVLRGVAELVVIYATHDWRCLYGLMHNGATFVLATVLFFRLPRPFSPSDHRALGFLLIYIATLFFESINAWQFSLLADPSKGIYFAANTPHFAFVNGLTWVELACLWPWFFLQLWKSRTDFLPNEYAPLEQPGFAHPENRW